MSLHGVSPFTTYNASCFDASRLSINTSAADFPEYTFNKAAIFQKTCSGHHDCQLLTKLRLYGMEEGVYAQD